jgi:hypothetical protein
MSFAGEFLRFPDLFPGRRAGEAWGDRRVVLDVPGGPYAFDGLSVRQEEGVRTRFAGLCREGGGAVVESRIFAVPAGDFREVDTRGWEYTLDLDPSPAALRFAGLRLMARLDWTPSLAAALWTPEAEGEPFWPVLENVFRVLAAYRLLEIGGAVLHSAAVTDGEAAWLLLGPSGAGKSTAAGLCREGGAAVLSDDLNAVVLEGDVPRVVQLPFTGDLGGDACPGSLPLRAVLRLVKGSENRLQPLSPARALAGLVAAAPFVNRDPWREDALLGVLERLARAVPSYELVFSLGGGLWDSLQDLP